MAELAINGGTPLRTIPYPVWPVYDETEKQAILEVLESRQWGTLGPCVLAFEKEFAEYLGAARVQTVNSGTVSLEVILRALGIGPGDEVIIPPYTFIATATAVLMVGAIPVFADIDPASNNMDPQKAEEAITPRTRAIMPVHIAGVPADMDAFTALAGKYKLSLIEDAAQAHGSEWNGRKVGSLGTAGSFSFQLSKNMSAGEGGAIVTNDEELAEKTWSIHHVGRKKDGVWYGHYTLSSNLRMTDWQAAILRSQLTRLDGQIDTREKNVKLLNNLLGEIDGVEPFTRDPRATRVTHHLYMFRYNSEVFDGIPKNRFVEALTAEGIPAHSGYTPIQKQPLFKTEEVLRITSGMDYASVELPAADKACDETVWITQDALLGVEKDMNDVRSSILKIRDNCGELG
ncbi:MAG: DegT/DnrJ/EryC1/StrS family aminotransferase [Spirochaetaceae bacterium]|nr:DegT/DnrJ/EryC1/StrS family aminotransferase [Spirochaetaceae bacterium]